MRPLAATLAALLLGLALMVGMYWILDILPIVGFAALTVAFTALSRHDQVRRDRGRQTLEARKP